MRNDPLAVVRLFNERINAGDLDGLGALMTEDHVFVDSAGAVIAGGAACLEAWRAFFDAFPDYRNAFRSMAVRGDRVAILGASICSDPRLDGPAIWTARIADGKVREWRVHEDSPANRAALGPFE